MRVDDCSRLEAAVASIQNRHRSRSRPLLDLESMSECCGSPGRMSVELINVRRARSEACAGLDDRVSHPMCAGAHVANRAASPPFCVQQKCIRPGVHAFSNRNATYRVARSARRQ